MAKKYHGGIPTPTSISVKKSEPSDDRDIVLTKSDLATLEYVYGGIIVKVEDENFKQYRWNGNDQTDLNNWESVLFMRSNDINSDSEENVATSLAVKTLKNLIDNKLDKSGGTVTGSVTFEGDVIVRGATIQVDSEIKTADAVLELNSNEAGNGVTLGYSGFEIDRGTQENFWFGFDEVRDRFTVGKISALNATEISTTAILVTRAETLTNNDILKYDSATQKLIDSGVKVSELRTTNNFVAGVDYNSVIGSNANLSFATGGTILSSLILEDGVVKGYSTRVLTLANLGYTGDSNADNYSAWNLQTNGIQRTTIQSGGVLDIVAGANVSVSYSAGGKVTINSSFTDTTYTVGDGGLTERNFTTALLNKLNGVEENANRITNNNQILNGAGYITSYVNTQLSDEEVQDIVGAMVSGNTESNISVVYQDADGTLDFSLVGYNNANWDRADNRSINSNPIFNTTNGVLTIGRQDGGSFTVGLDGRYSLQHPHPYVSNVRGSGQFMDGAYLQFGGNNNTNNDFIAYNETTNSYYFNADATRTNTSANATIYALSGNSNQWNTAYTHSQQAHAPVNAQQNVQSDWNALDNSDAFIENKPTLLSQFTNDLGNNANWDRADNRSINSNPIFNTTNGVLTIGRQDGGSFTVGLDGRYSLQHPHPYVSNVRGSGQFMDGAYLQFGGNNNTNNDFIAYNETTNSYYFNADATRTNTSANATIYALSGNSKQWNTAYTHSQQAHAPVNAQQNVQSDWNALDNSDAFIENKPTLLSQFTNDLGNYGSFLVESDLSNVAYKNQQNTFSENQIINGRIGINASSPNYDLVVRGITGSSSVIDLQANSTTTDSIIRFSQNGSSVSYIGYDSSKNLLKLSGTNTFSEADHLTISNTGQIKAINTITAPNFIGDWNGETKEQLLSNVVYKNISNTFTSTQTISNGSPRLNLYSTDVGEDDWGIINNNGVFGLYNQTSENYALYISGINTTLNGTLTTSGATFLKSTLNTWNNLRVLNKASNNYVTWATRNTTGTEVVYDLSNLGSGSFNSNVTAINFIGKWNGETKTQLLSGLVKNTGTQTLVGNFNFNGTDPSGNFNNAPIEIREINRVLGTESSRGFAPAIVWHWGGRTAGDIALESDGIFKFRSHVDISVYRDVQANNFIGNWNGETKTQLLSGLATTTQLISKENSFTKNTAFNKNFGTTTGTVAQGNDSRLNNGQTAFGWGDHRQYNGVHNYLGAGYVGGGLIKPNDSLFGAGKLKLQMLKGTILDTGDNYWYDSLWLSSYNGSDVKGSHGLFFSKRGAIKIGFSRQDFDSEEWGDFTEIYHSSNSNKSDVNWTANNLNVNGISTFEGGTVINPTSTNVPDYFKITNFSKSFNLVELGVTDDSGVIRLYRSDEVETVRFNSSSNSWVINNLGIGTTTPTEKLDVNGNIKSSGNVTANEFVGLHSNDALIRAKGYTYDRILQSKYGGAGIGDVLDFYVAGASTSSENLKMRLTSLGRLGVGTSNPTETIDVVGNIKASGNLDVTGGIKLAGHKIDKGTNDNNLRIFNETYDYLNPKHIMLAVSPDNVKQFAVNVGIGTDAPGERLHLADGNFLFEGASQVGMLFKLANTIDGELPSTAGTYHASAPFVNPIFKIGRVIKGGDGAPQFRWMYQDDSRGEHVVMELDSEGIMSSVRQAGSQSRGSHFEAHAEGDAQPYFRLNSYPYMRLEMGNGSSDATDVAIGRSTPNTLSFLIGTGTGTEIGKFTNTGLDVNGNLDVSNTATFGGNVGIGTTNPLQKLHILGNSTESKIQLSVTGNTGNTQIHFGDDDDVNSGRVAYSHLDDSISLFTNNTEKFRITDVGRVVLNSNLTYNFIGSDTNDGSDSRSLYLGGGGDASSSRGAVIGMHGNEYTTAGRLFLSAGNVTGGNIEFHTGGLKRLDILENGNVEIGNTNKFTFSQNLLSTSGTNGIYLRSAVSTATNPSYSNSDDTDTGMYLSGNNTLGLTTGGVARYVINSSGLHSMHGTLFLDDNLFVNNGTVFADAVTITSLLTLGTSVDINMQLQHPGGGGRSGGTPPRPPGRPQYVTLNTNDDGFYINGTLTLQNKLITTNSSDDILLGDGTYASLAGVLASASGGEKYTWATEGDRTSQRGMAEGDMGVVTATRKKYRYVTATRKKYRYESGSWVFMYDLDSAHTHSFNELTSKPTTLSGYGIQNSEISAITDTLGYFKANGTTPLTGNLVFNSSSNSKTVRFGSGTGSKTIDLPTNSGTLALTSQLPTLTSQLTNNSDFVTSSQIANFATLNGDSGQHFETSELQLGNWKLKSVGNELCIYEGANLKAKITTGGVIKATNFNMDI